MNAVSLKTLTPSRYVKISNVWNRDFELTDESRIELEQDFTEELQSVTKFKKLIVVTSDMVKLGAELGSIFVEFWNDKTSQQGVKKVKGRIYDGCEIKTCYIEESLYRDHFFPDAADTIAAATGMTGDRAKEDEQPVAAAAEVVEDPHDDQKPDVNSNDSKRVNGQQD